MLQVVEVSGGGQRTVPRSGPPSCRVPRARVYSDSVSPAHVALSDTVEEVEVVVLWFFEANKIAAATSGIL